MTIILTGLVFCVLSIVAYHPVTAGALPDENNQTNQTNQSFSALNKKGLELLNSGSYNESVAYFDKALGPSCLHLCTNA